MKLPNFVVRVVLHGAKDLEDYNDFHEEIEAKHYYRIIMLDEGDTYELPPATYRAGGVNWADLPPYALTFRRDHLVEAGQCPVLQLETDTFDYHQPVEDRLTQSRSMGLSALRFERASSILRLHYAWGANRAS